MITVRSILDQDVNFEIAPNRKLIIKGKNHCPLRSATDTDITEEEWILLQKVGKDMSIFKNKLIYPVLNKRISQAESSEIKEKGDIFGVEKSKNIKKNK